MTKVRVLAIDGGGIRGLIPARVLVELERMAGRPVAELFDVVAGTSTGGILALALTKPGPDGRPAFSAEDCLALYVREGGLIFPRWYGRSGASRPRPAVTSLFIPTRGRQLLGALLRPRRYGNARYRPEGLIGVLTRYFGGARLSEALSEVIVLSYDMGAARPITFRRRDARSAPGRDPPMVQVALATSAAPTYFPPVAIPWGGSEQLVLVDGGVVANNPTMVAYLDALAQFRTASPGGDLQMVVASIGTGTPPTEPATYESVSSQSWLSLGADLLGVVFDGTSEIQHEILGGLLGTGDVGGSYWRFQVELRDCSLALDDASPANIAALRRLADRLVEQRAEDLESLARMLR